MQKELFDCLQFALSPDLKTNIIIDDTQRQIIATIATFITMHQTDHNHRLKSQQIEGDDDTACQRMLLGKTILQKDFSSSLFERETVEWRRKPPFSVLKKVIREPKYVPFIKQYGRLPDRQGMTFFFPTRELLEQAVKHAK